MKFITKIHKIGGSHYALIPSYIKQKTEFEVGKLVEVNMNGVKVSEEYEKCVECSVCKFPIVVRKEESVADCPVCNTELLINELKEVKEE